MTARTIRIVTLSTVKALRLRSQQSDDLLVNGAGWIAHAGVVVLCNPRHRDVLIALLARPGALWTVHDLVETLYADDPDGGPDCADAHTRHLIYDLRSVSKAVGIKIEVIGRTYQARLV